MMSDEEFAKYLEAMELSHANEMAALNEEILILKEKGKELDREINKGWFI